MKTMTIEEQVKEIKYCAELAADIMENHKITWEPDDGSFENIIDKMHNAKNKYQLGEAYYEYIKLCIRKGYSDGDITCGIIQNDAKNKEFNVNIDSIIKQLINIRYGKKDINKPKSVIEQNDVKPDSATNSETKPENSNENESSDNSKFNNKRINKIKNKVKYVNGVLNTLLNNQSENPAADAEKIKSICEETKQKILSIDRANCTEEEITVLNDAYATINDLLKSVEAFSLTVKGAATVISNTNQAQQAAVAHTEGGFNISNFIKPQPGINNTPMTAITSKHKPTAFPHQICGLTDEQIAAEASKHFKVIDKIPAYPLYDLLNNKLLPKKMKEFNSKQRANNPYLTQVNINEYIDVPELLSKYSLCFTIPCNDKDKVIIVLFNPNPVQDKNGMLNYPLHIFKATRKNNK